MSTVVIPQRKMFKAVRMLFQVLQEFVLISIPGSCPLKFLMPRRVVKCSECGLSVSDASLSWRLQGPFAEEMIFTVLILLRRKTFCRQLSKSRVQWRNQDAIPGSMFPESQCWAGSPAPSPPAPCDCMYFLEETRLLRLFLSALLPLLQKCLSTLEKHLI